MRNCLILTVTAMMRLLKTRRCLTRLRLTRLRLTRLRLTRLRLIRRCLTRLNQIHLNQIHLNQIHLNQIHYNRINRMKKKNKTWVLVGNGPSVSGGGLGAQIDSYDEVVRMNTFSLKGFEADAGTRTTLWCSSSDKQQPDWSLGQPARCLLLSGRIDEMDCILVPKDYFWAKKTRVRKQGCLRDKPLLVPSTGFVAICWLLETGMAQHLDLIGVDHFSKINSRRHHYWNPKNYNQPPQHDGAAEEKLLHRFVAAGKLRYVRSTEQGERHD